MAVISQATIGVRQVCAVRHPAPKGTVAIGQSYERTPILSGARAISVAIVIGIVLFLAALWLHLGMIRLAKRTLQPASVNSLRLSLAYLVVLASHLAVTVLFALGFAGAAGMGLGGFDKEPAMSAMDLFYFSLINITTLGLGDIYPIGHLRALAGIESLTGFLLISCTAQFVFSTMKKQGA